MGEEFSRIVPEEQGQDSYLKQFWRSTSKDALSGLLNRGAMERCIRDRLNKMTPEETCALFIIDLDNFKNVNDTLGHPVGDEAIRQTARILSSIFRASDIVGRLGGDEFAVFLCGKITEASVLKMAAEICEKLQMTLGGRETVNVTASVGVHMATKGQELEGLYQTADLALYKAKKAGKHQFCLKNHGNLQRGGMRPASAITLATLLENMESGVVLLEMGETPQIVYASPSFFRLLETDTAHFPLPKPLYELIHPDDFMAVLSALQEGLQQDKAVESTHRVRANEKGDWLWWQVRAVKMDDRNSIPMMLVTTTDVSKLKKTQSDQEDQIRRLQTAFQMTSRHLWNVDLQTQLFHGDILEGQAGQTKANGLHFPEDLIDHGWIYPESADKFRLFAKELLKGNPRGFGNFAVRHKDSGCYGWVSVSYQMLFDDVGQAVQAVGVLEELPSCFIGQEHWWIDDQRMPENVVADLVMWMRADLTEDSIEALWMEGTDHSGKMQEVHCSEILRTEKQHVFCKRDQKRLADHYDRKALVKMYQNGQHWLCAEYQRVDYSGNIRWVRQIFYLAENPTNRHLLLFVYLLRIDPEHRFEMLLHREPKRDAVSHLYSREAITQLAETLFSDRKSGNRAVVLFQINGMDQLPAGPERDRLLYGLSCGLSLVLGGSCFLGQYSPHQIVIVFPTIIEKEGLRRRLEESISVLRRMLSVEAAYRLFRFVLGIDLLPAATANYRQMVMRTIETCALHWSAAADTIAFVQEQPDFSWAHLQESGDSQISIHTDEMVRPLSEEEKDLALDGVSTMLAARSLDAAITGVLKAIGEYYHADRVYSLMLVEKNRAVIMTFEWTNEIRPSIQQAVSGMPLQKFPLLMKCMKKRAPVFLTRSCPVQWGEDQKDDWHFTAFPLMREPQNTIDGFLCIENARRHPADAAVFGTLIPFMMQQRARFRDRQNVSATAQRLMSVPDLRAYIDTLRTLTSDYFSSMGAVCLEILSPTAENHKKGAEYGGQMVWCVIHVMSELFGQTLLFRVKEAEFIAFYPNTTREVFLGRCGRLWSILQRRYPKQIRLGQSWASGRFHGENLAEKASAAMKSANAEQFAQDLFVLPAIFHLRSSNEKVWREQFQVYYQPKIDMNSGELAGVEALVRRVTEDGSIIAPEQFIPLMEETGTIRELDLFVLEESLAQVEKWQSMGFGVVPISVNLSRITLAYPAILASVLAIQSRYPTIPESALELEITESGDSFQTSELRDFVDQFHACGLYMSLDDFGSQYANLSLFTNVKFDTVKLDRSLIMDLEHNPISQMLVQDLIEICQTYGMKCVAEGVETKEQVRMLLKMGCIYAQGFYFDAPLSAASFEQKYLHRDARS